ncbi:MAG TPA: cobalamin biosynthesis protein [Polyangiales bacterium]|nr:cobalamin biosynthesis protein [Polyangiales bacterium]
MIAAGLGCRKGCASADLVRALETALASAGRALSDVSALYAPEFKAEESALVEIARQLGKPLVLLGMDALQLQAAHALTQSAQVAVRFGIPSIAETAALAGACALAESSAMRPTLLGPRQIAGGASCALAVATDFALGDPQ